MIKLIATDIDGTILIPEGEFTEGVKKCIKKLDDSGVKVVLVTGRMNAAAQLIAKDLGFSVSMARKLRNKALKNIKERMSK